MNDDENLILKGANVGRRDSAYMKDLQDKLTSSIIVESNKVTDMCDDDAKRIVG